MSRLIPMVMRLAYVFDILTPNCANSSDSMTLILSLKSDYQVSLQMKMIGINEYTIIYRMVIYMIEALPPPKA